MSNENYLKKDKKIILTIYVLISLTVSFDLFLNISIAGFSFRISQILLVLPAFLLIGNIVRCKVIKIPLGGRSLLLWTLFLIIFIPNTTFIERNIGYIFWLFLDILLVFSLTFFVEKMKAFMYLFKWYIYSFVFVSLFGIFQFLMGIAGVNPPFVTQWWDVNLPRVNGFSYEPSYYATYLITGWVLVFYLTYSNTIPKKKAYFILSVITIALIISSSRMGLVVMALWVVRYIFLFFMYLLKGQIHKRYAKITILFFVLLSVLVFSLGSLSKYKFLLNGTGLQGTAAHSVEERTNALNNTFEVFLNNPIIGVSLGGVAPAIGGLHNSYIVDNKMAKNFEGTNIFLEVLAGSGIIGVIPFVFFVIIIIFKPLKLSKVLEDDDYKHIIKGLVFSLIALLIILQFNQNILRMYLWLHIGLLTSIYSIVLNKYKILNKVSEEIAR